MAEQLEAVLNDDKPQGLSEIQKSTYSEYAIHLRYASIGKPKQPIEYIGRYRENLNNLNWRHSGELYRYMHNEGTKRLMPSNPLFFISRNDRNIFSGKDYHLGARHFLEEFIRKKAFIFDKKVSQTKGV